MEEQGIKNRKRTIIEAIIIIFCLSVIVFCVSFERGTLYESSMNPTLTEGTTAFFFKYAYVFSPPKRGDIIEFSHDGVTVCKRVVGIGGDTVSFNIDCTLYVNGESQDEPYVETATIPHNEASYTVPEGKVFVLGDNRIVSNDSRYWDDPYIDISDIRGKLIFTLKPWAYSFAGQN